MKPKIITLLFCGLTVCAYSQNTTFQQRAKKLCNEMTLEEKTSLMMDNSPAIPRLGIPAFQWWNEALHGVARNGLATVFPQTIGMAASFDPALLQQVYTAVSDEARAKAEKARQEDRSNVIRDCHSGLRTSISSVTHAGDGDRRLTVKILI